MSRSMTITAVAAVLLAGAAFAQTPPAGIPAGTTATCGDGTFSTSPTKKGACSSHKGVKDWYGTGPVKVWANKGSMTYHCPDDKWYGKSADGSFMSETDAKAQGFHADHGKGCQK